MEWYLDIGSKFSMLYRSTYYDLHHLVIHRFRSFLTLASCDTADKRGKELQEQLPRRVLNEDCCCCFHWQMQIAYLLIPCPQQHIQNKMQETRGKAKQIKKYNACTHINEQQLRDLFKLRKSQQSDSSKLVSCLFMLAGLAGISRAHSAGEGHFDCNGKDLGSGKGRSLGWEFKWSGAKLFYSIQYPNGGERLRLTTVS